MRNAHTRTSLVAWRMIMALLVPLAVPLGIVADSRRAFPQEVGPNVELPAEPPAEPPPKPPIGANKAQYLADGIYVALVTTFAGLAVAIPAATLAHVFEGRIQNLFRELDETMLGMLAQLDRLERRLRASRSRFGPSASPVVRMVGNRWNAGVGRVVRRR